MDDFIAFVLAFGRRGKALMGGVAGIVLSGFSASAGSMTGRLVLAGVALFCFFSASYLVWLDEYQRADQAEAKIAALNTELAVRDQIRPPPSPLDVHQDAEVQTKVSTLDVTLRAALFKVALAGEASISDNGMETIRQRTGFLVRDGAIFRVQEGWRAPLRRWAEGEAAQRSESAT